MLSLNEINNLNAVQRRAIVERLACDLLGIETGQFKLALADHIGSSYDGLKNWWRGGNAPPLLLIMYLQSEVERRRMEKVLLGLKGAIDAIDQ